ncbi:rhodanese-like domain-containing protein [Desulfococcaceae bacterium HSG9]|nr:rhodanese-like domain-containing protein [Desulfococcaceae bacterium HSG9]
MKTNNTLKGVSILSGIAIFLSFFVNYVSPAGIALIGQWDESQGAIRAKTKAEKVFDESEIKDVNIGKAVFDRQIAVFIDARSVEDYKDGHIKGAVSLPVGEFDMKIDEFLNKYPPDRPIVTYCSGRTCDDSHRLAEMLTAMGYLHVSIMIDGYPEWQKEGFPIE